MRYSLFIEAMASFPDNLRFLCGFHVSISAVCRELEINRSQFNKYLSGATRPSPFAMRRICDFFGVDEHDLYLPQDQLARKFEQRRETAEPISASPHANAISALTKLSGPAITAYQGAYFEYYLSMTYPGYVLRSFVQLKCVDYGAYYKRIERINPSHLSERRFRCVYRGIAFFLADRIFLVDYESLSKTEISQTILFPNYKSQLTYLKGLKLGVSADSRHTPIATRTVFEYLGETVNLKKALAMCGLFDLGSDEISQEIKMRISNAIDIEVGQLTPVENI